jgi:hypothetical protein
MNRQQHRDGHIEDIVSGEIDMKCTSSKQSVKSEHSHFLHELPMHTTFIERKYVRVFADKSNYNSIICRLHYIIFGVGNDDNQQYALWQR